MGAPQPCPQESIPSKIYYSISEVSEYTGVEPHVLRYWETKYSRLSPKRVGGNQRKYTRHDLTLLYEIIHLLYQEGYTLDGAEKKLRSGLAAVRAEREADKAVAEAEGEQDEPQEPEPPAKAEPPAQRPGIPRDEIRLIRNEVADILRTLTTE